MTRHLNLERAYWPLLGIIVFGGLIVRLIHFSLTIGSDDQVWVTVAREVATGATRTDEPVYYTRFVWTWTLIAWGKLGALSLEWTAVLMFLLSGLTSVFIAAATRVAHGALAALLAALVYSAPPLAISFDPVTLPDGLAVCILAAICWTFARYLSDPRTRLLIVPGLLIGVLFGVKNYFMLVSIPCTLAMLALAPTWRQRMTHAGFLAGTATASLAVVLLLGAFSGVSMSSHVVSAGNYVEYVSQGMDAGAQPSGIKQLLALLAERGLVISTLFVGFGAVMGMLTLGGFAYSARAWRNPLHLFVASTTVLILLFLMFMPVSLSPLIFTQIHDRYLTVVLPTLAMSTGIALATIWGALREPAPRWAAACLLAGIAGYSLWIPGELHDRYRTLEIRGLDQVTARAGSSGTTLLLPVMYRRLVPGSYRERGTTLRFVDLITPQGATAALDEIAANPSASLMVFRLPYRATREYLRTGDYDQTVSYGPFVPLLTEAQARRARIEEVRVPYDTLRVWLARAGIDTRGELVGWVIRGTTQ